MRTYLFILLLIFPTLLFAQCGEIILKGTFWINGATKTYSYIVHCTADSAGNLKGYSITNYGDTDETKTSITGHLNHKKNEMTLTESHLISTKSHYSKSDFCFMKSQLTLTNNTDAFGVFVGYREDSKTVCSSGAVNLKVMNNSLKRAFDKKHPHPIIQPVKVVSADTPKIYTGKVCELQGYNSKQANNAPAQFIQINSGETRTFNFTDTSVDMAVWDNKNIDGDIIDIYFNEQLVLSHYVLARKPQKLQLMLQKDKISYLRIVCVNEGTERTNTASIRLASGSTVYTIGAVTRMHKDVTIMLKAIQQ